MPARGDSLVPVDLLSRQIAAQFCARAETPAVFETVSTSVWRRNWVSYKHYGRGNDAMLSYPSRYVFGTAITNARFLGRDQTHLTFRWKVRTANAWCTERVPGVDYLRRFLQHALPAMIVL